MFEIFLTIRIIFVIINRMSVDPLMKKIKMYRYLFVVNYLHNIFYVRMFLPLIITTAGFLNIFGTCGALRFKNYVTLIEYIIVYGNSQFYRFSLGLKYWIRLVTYSNLAVLFATRAYEV